MESLLGVLTDLNQIVPILVHWLHLLSAVVWIGGFQLSALGNLLNLCDKYAQKAQPI